MTMVSLVHRAIMVAPSVLWQEHHGNFRITIVILARRHPFG
jgi:hypothetical protein